MSGPLDQIEEDVATLDRTIATWSGVGRPEDQANEICEAQSALAIRIAGAIRYWLQLAQPRIGATPLGALDPLRKSAELEVRQQRVHALAQRLRELVCPAQASRALEAPDR